MPRAEPAIWTLALIYSGPFSKLKRDLRRPGWRAERDISARKEDISRCVPLAAVPFRPGYRCYIVLIICHAHAANAGPLGFRPRNAMDRLEMHLRRNVTLGFKYSFVSKRFLSHVDLFTKPIHAATAIIMVLAFFNERKWKKLFEEKVCLFLSKRLIWTSTSNKLPQLVTRIDCCEFITNDSWNRGSE